MNEEDIQSNKDEDEKDLVLGEEEERRAKDAEVKLASEREKLKGMMASEIETNPIGEAVKRAI